MRRGGEMGGWRICEEKKEEEGEVVYVDVKK